MAVPTISSISPNVGTPTGQQAVEILGTGFRLPTPPAPGVIPVPPSPTPVRVLFGGISAVLVQVISDTRLFAFTPKRNMPIGTDGITTLGVEDVDVTVENIDDNGVLIPGETVTIVNGYQYKRPGITHQDSDVFDRVTRQLLDLLRSEVISECYLNTSTDFDPETGGVRIPVESLPQVIITGPSLEFNAFFTFRGQYDIPTNVTTEFFRARRHRVVDLVYDVLGVTDSDVELLNLMALWETVVDRNTSLDFVCDPTKPNETIPLEFHILKSPTYRRDESLYLSDIRLFTAQVVLKGYPFTGLPSTTQDGLQSAVAEITEDPTLTLENVVQIGDDNPATQGAPTRSPPEADVPAPPRFPTQGAPTRSPPEQGRSK